MQRLVGEIHALTRQVQNIVTVRDEDDQCLDYACPRRTVGLASSPSESGCPISAAGDSAKKIQIFNGLDKKIIDSRVEVEKSSWVRYIINFRPHGHLDYMTKLVIPFSFQTYGRREIILAKQGIFFYSRITAKIKKCDDSSDNIVIELYDREKIQDINYRISINKH